MDLRISPHRSKIPFINKLYESQKELNLARIRKWHVDAYNWADDILTAKYSCQIRYASTCHPLYGLPHHITAYKPEAWIRDNIM